MKKIAYWLACVSLVSGCGAGAGAGTEAESDDVGTSAASLRIGPVNKALDYFQCAAEGGTCTFWGLKYMAFGASGQFLYRSVGSNALNTIACNTTTFGGNPIAGAKACYFANYAWFGSGGQTLFTPAPTIPIDIAYGANGIFKFKTINNTVFDCTVATFGDPVSGGVNDCYLGAAPFYYSPSATEGQTLTGLNKTPVAFGAAGGFAFKILTGNKPCSRPTFDGADPAPTILKQCYTFTLNGAFLRDEGQVFSVDPNTKVAYGSGLNGNFLRKVFPVSQINVPCSNATFGGDPDVGVAKHCWYTF